MSEAGVAVRAVEIVPGQCYALGGTLALDGRIGWAPRDLRGWQAVNCYLLTEGDRAVLVDTGPACFEAKVLGQLESVVPRQSPIAIFLSRAELDVVGNVVAISQAYEISEIVAGGNPNPFDAMDQVGLSGSGTVPKMDRFGGDLARAKAHVVLGSGRSLEIIKAPVRMLTCCWSYDSGTKTLFAADFFGKQVQQSGAYAPLAGTGASLKALAPTLQSRYWWLRGSRTDKLVEATQEVFNTYDIERIAPTHGCVVEGREAVLAHRDLFFALLEELGDSR